MQETDFEAPTGRNWLLVNEEFSAPQGEGATMGRPAYWVRCGGCNQHCWWCDTPQTWVYDDRHAEMHDKHKLYDPRTELYRVSLPVLAERIRDQSLRRVVFTGGEPLLQAEQIAKLIRMLGEYSADRFSFEFETAGSIAPGELAHLPHVSFNVSPKLASSGNPRELRRNLDAINAFRECAGIFKFVIDTRNPPDVETDLREVQDLIDICNLPGERIWLSPCGTTVEEVISGMWALEPIAVKFGWNLSSRLHVLMHGNERGH